MQETPKIAESEESVELFRGTLGFDFIFAKDKRGKRKCYCIEFNGAHSGIAGADRLPLEHKQDVHAKIRSLRGTTSPEYDRKLEHAAKLTDLFRKQSEDPNVSEEEIEKLDAAIDAAYIDAANEPLFHHAYKNPPFIERISADKSRQVKYVPRNSRPRTWRRGHRNKSPSGLWILKPTRSMHGKGILICNDQILDNLSHSPKLLAGYLIQEFISPEGAADAPEELANHPSSLRLLVDFRYMRNGDVTVDFRGAYNRVSPFSTSEADKGRKNIHDVYVVSKARGAKSLPATREEVEMAEKVALKTIQNLVLDFPAE